MRVKGLATLMKRKDVDRQLIDLAILWLRGELKYTQFCRLLHRPIHSNTYIQLARALRVAYRSNLIK